MTLINVLLTVICFKKSLCIAISNGLDKLKARKNARIRPSILMHFTEDGFHIEQEYASRFLN
ncbi:hypothetical protein T05_1683 [Trichinella murrelli]|uniref:Uncharacterized protein n=1 Tax=Trichinella murrelli TaxID=144512 RepID=A0A0V0U4I1_9BILA|nr:hypothetical protein T05_1683 [Trichinella murrelli]